PAGNGLRVHPEARSHLTGGEQRLLVVVVVHDAPQFLRTATRPRSARRSVPHANRCETDETRTMVPRSRRPVVLPASASREPTHPAEMVEPPYDRVTYGPRTMTTAPGPH